MMPMEIRREKSLAKMEREARLKHMTKILFVEKGKTYATFREPGSTVKFRDGKVYRVHDDGSLRRLKP